MAFPWPLDKIQCIQCEDRQHHYQRGHRRSCNLSVLRWLIRARRRELSLEKWRAFFSRAICPLHLRVHPRSAGRAHCLIREDIRRFTDRGTIASTIRYVSGSNRAPAIATATSGHYRAIALVTILPRLTERPSFKRYKRHRVASSPAT